MAKRIFSPAVVPSATFPAHDRQRDTALAMSPESETPDHVELIRGYVELMDRDWGRRRARRRGAGVAMSENLDLVRSICADWERGDYSSVEWAHPEIEVVSADGPTPGSWRGLAEMAEGYRQFLSAWDDVRTDVEEYRELDGDRVLVFTHTSGGGKTSGLELGPISATTAVLFDFGDGMVTRLGLYWDRDRALADVGLEN